MHDDRLIVEAHLDRVLKERIRPAVYPRTTPLQVEAWHVPGEPVPVTEALDGDRFEPAKVGDPWGPPWGTTWWRLSGWVPQEWAGRTVEAVVDLGFGQDSPGFSAEGLVYRPDGTAVKGLHPRNHWVRLASPAKGDEEVTLYVEAAANPQILGPTGATAPTPLGDLATAGSAPLYRLVQADLAVFDDTVWELLLDLEVLTDLMKQLPVESPRRWEILRACARALDVLDLHDVAAHAAQARSVLEPALAVRATTGTHELYAVGHAHIDSAWLWPLRETVRKVARTAANVVDLMDANPGFTFAMSQAQQFAWLKQHRPDVYARVQEKVAAGSLVPVGGMWVEADTNMPGGEAMARQFVHGKRFFLDEFGIDTPDVWLPDSFGYSAALPQLIALSGSQWFLSQKMSWNTTNRFPHHTFWWEGIDGSRVYSHFPSADTYNSDLSGKDVAHAVSSFAEKGGAARSLVPFGYGDGGGGPSREMLARAERLADLDGSARVRLASPAQFFTDAQAEYPDAPVWSGEMYLELHRGTYTSQAKTKQGNRRSEHLLREAELWAATATVRHGEPYPYEQLDRLWKTVLLHQFHDILPGSSIAWVHREAQDAYAAVAAELGMIIGTAQTALAGDPAAGRTVVFNASPHDRDGVPALAATPLEDDPGAVSVVDDGNGHVMDNGLLHVVVDARGLVTSVVDIATGRETVAPGAAANLLQIHPDHPAAWDAWDIDHYYSNTVTDLTDADEVTAEPDDGSITVRRSLGSSRVDQVLTLHPGARRLDVTTTVDWHEREKILKAAFPLDVRADRSASETQFGHVFRATHTNTSWDAARFEICAHRWIHVGEPGWGAALVNDSTYGHDVSATVRPDGGTTTTVRLSLLRAPRYPDPETDQGTHVLRYALVPAAGITDAVREGYRINLPERRVPGDATVVPLVAVDEGAAAVVVEAVKLADDRSGDVIVRLYEALGGRAQARLRSGFPLAGAQVVDLLERPLDDAPVPDRVDGETLTLTLRPFQIVTLRLSVADQEKE